MRVIHTCVVHLTVHTRMVFAAYGGVIAYASENCFVSQYHQRTNHINVILNSK